MPLPVSINSKTAILALSSVCGVLPSDAELGFEEEVLFAVGSVFVLPEFGIHFAVSVMLFTTGVLKFHF